MTDLLTRSPLTEDEKHEKKLAYHRAYMRQYRARYPEREQKNRLNDAVSKLKKAGFIVLPPTLKIDESVKAAIDVITAAGKGA